MNFEIPTQSFLLTVHDFVLGVWNIYAFQADLAKVDRKRTPWLIVLLHAPWYNSNWAHQGEGDSMMASMEPLLYSAHVDMVIAGHVHAYERVVGLESLYIPQLHFDFCREIQILGSCHLNHLNENSICYFHCLFRSVSTMENLILVVLFT